MIGHGHHFIPQFLLKGFASRVKKKTFYCWYFRAGSRTCRVNIGGIAKQRDFHGDPSESGLESIISQRENEYAPLVSRLRQGTISPEDKPLIDEFVIHLTMRSRNLRQGMSSSIDLLLSAWLEHLKTPVIFNNL